MGGPWFVAGAVVGLDKWHPSFSPDSLDGFTAPIWIRLPQLPLLYWDAKHISRFVAKLGTPLWLDASTNNWDRTSYARVCVRLNLASTLVAGVWIEGYGGRFFQKFEYEGISHLCFNCCKVGHKSHQCKEPLKVSNKVTSTPSTSSTSSIPSKAHDNNLSSTDAAHPTQNTNPTSEITCPPPHGNSSLTHTSSKDPPDLGEVGRWTLVQRRQKPRPPKNNDSGILPTPPPFIFQSPRYIPKPKPKSANTGPNPKNAPILSATRPSTPPETIPRPPESSTSLPNPSPNPPTCPPILNLSTSMEVDNAARKRKKALDDEFSGGDASPSVLNV